MGVSKGAKTMMMESTTTRNIYKLLWCTFMGDVASVETDNDATKLWHMRLDHLNEYGMIEIHMRNFLKGVCICIIGFCKYCVLGKQCIVRIKTRKHKTNGILDYVHFDIWGPTKEPSVGVSKYFVTFTNDFSRKVWVYFMKYKFEVLFKFKLWKAEVESQVRRKIKYLRPDNETEYTNKKFLHLCEENGI